MDDNYASHLFSHVELFRVKGGWGWRLKTETDHVMAMNIVPIETTDEAMRSIKQARRVIAQSLVEAEIRFSPREDGAK